MGIVSSSSVLPQSVQDFCRRPALRGGGGSDSDPFALGMFQCGNGIYIKKSPQ